MYCKKPLEGEQTEDDVARMALRASREQMWHYLLFLLGAQDRKRFTQKETLGGERGELQPPPSWAHPFHAAAVETSMGPTCQSATRGPGAWREGAVLRL